MKHFLPTLLLSVLLVSCGAASTSIDAENQNPLTASRYGDELADTLSNLIINADPIIEEAGMKETIQREIERAKGMGNDARAIIDTGKIGALISINQQVSGFTALIGNTLYFSSDFATDPGLNLHVYITTTVDPRDAEFPDNTAIDLGVVQSAYGPQQYTLSKSQMKTPDLRTVVLYDKTLGRIFGFAQLSFRN